LFRKRRRSKKNTISIEPRERNNQRRKREWQRDFFLKGRKKNQGNFTSGRDWQKRWCNRKTAKRDRENNSDRRRIEPRTFLQNALLVALLVGVTRRK